MRKQPSVQSAKVTTLKRGTQVHVAGKVKGGNWYLVERDDKPLGYVYGTLLREPEAPPKQVAAVPRTTQPAAARPLKPIESEQESCLAAPNAGCILFNALRAARGLSDVDTRVRLLRSIGKARAKGGDIAGARETFAEVRGAVSEIQGAYSVRSRAFAMTSLAEAQMEAGDREGARDSFAEAKTLAQTRPASEHDTAAENRVYALSNIADTQTDVGEKQAALRTLDLALRTLDLALTHVARVPADDRRFAQRGVVINMWEAGDLAAAYETVKRLGTARYRGYGFSELAGYQAAVGEKSAARATFDKALHEARKPEGKGILYYVVSELAFAGFVDEALDISSELSDPYNNHESAMKSIALAQVKAGDVRAGLRTANPGLFNALYMNRYLARCSRPPRAFR